MDQNEAPVIALDEFRRRRQAAQAAPRTWPPATMVWVPVWVWVPMLALP